MAIFQHLNTLSRREKGRQAEERVGEMDEPAFVFQMRESKML